MVAVCAWGVRSGLAERRDQLVDGAGSVTKIPLLVIVLSVVLAVVGLGVPRVMAQFNAAPPQPVGYTHMTHVKQLGLDCTFCHRNVTKGANASIPAVGQCMFCHRVVNKDNPMVSEAKAVEIEKVRQAFETNQPIDWVRVHRVPDHVRFVHAPHIEALWQPGQPIRQACATCHGDVQEMGIPQQVRPLNMGDCLNCHRQYAGQVAGASAAPGGAAAPSGAAQQRVLKPPTDCMTCHK
ncbi:MAG: cytochrome c3 family protein [Chloroflexi bacterium]|nr:cytochrome c3 family protein [Chloroflexota bacterium]